MAVYNPKTRYTWTPNDKFELSGDQFGQILNAFRAILSTPEAAQIILINKANLVVEEVMAKAVEQGIVKELPEQNNS